jgi:hypothetical protein
MSKNVISIHVEDYDIDSLRIAYKLEKPSLWDEFVFYLVNPNHD